MFRSKEGLDTQVKNSTLAPVLFCIFMIECDTLKYGDDCHEEKFCSLKQTKKKANFEYFLIEKLAFYLWDLTPVCWYGLRGRCYSAAWGSENEKSNPFREGESLASVWSTWVEKKPTALLPEAVAFSQWKWVPAASPKTRG